MRLTFDITDEVHRKLCIIPHGLRRYVYRRLIEQFADRLEANPIQILSEELLLHHQEMVDNGLILNPPGDSGSTPRGGPGTGEGSPDESEE